MASESAEGTSPLTRPNRDWNRQEELATGMLLGPLREYVTLFDDTSDMYDAVFTARTRGSRSLPGPAQVMAVILTQALTGLRCTVQAARTSYPLQAMGLAAGVFEQTHHAMYIAGNEDRATKWREHQNRWAWLPKGVRISDVIRSTVSALNVVYPTAAARQKEIERRQRVYQELCMGKHGNPIALRKWGVLIQNRTLSVLAGPYIGENAETPARRVVSYAAEYMLIGLAFFVGHSDMTPTEAGPLLPRIRGLMTRNNQLRQRDL
jgi:hypothetical protein